MWKLQKEVLATVNAVAVHHDAWSLKKLFSNAIRRVGVDNRSVEGHSPSRKSEGVQEFYDILWEFWGPQLKAMHRQRIARKELKQSPNSSGAAEVEIIPDDDDDACEEQSLKQAEQGIILEDVIDLLDTDGYEADDGAIEAEAEAGAEAEVKDAQPPPAQDEYPAMEDVESKMRALKFLACSYVCNCLLVGWVKSDVLDAIWCWQERDGQEGS